ncbi:MAG: hypothetical protein CMO47_11610 [Verrucomicrobiales bacterium]|nr:hypothetical protein [Verrucomicrobiales bacterium]|tara:strand:- start:1660 stop:2232 length:573 start_codon:yes stop_codon:yes gene_type:complete
MRFYLARTALVAIAVSFIGSSFSFADPLEDAIKDIREKYKKIEGAKLPSETMRWQPQDDIVSGNLTHYYSDGDLVKAHFRFGDGGHGEGDEYYYYWNDECFFVFADHGYWTFTGRAKPDGQGETVDFIFQDRLYFQKGQLIRHLHKEGESTDPKLRGEIMAATENSDRNDPEYAADILLRARLAAKAAKP